MRRVLAILIVVPMALVLLGIAVLGSTGGAAGLLHHNDPNRFLIRQVVFAMAAVLVCSIIASIDYHRWRRRDVMLCAGLAILVGLVAVFLPGLGTPAKGSHRWVNLGFTQIQPSEFVRIAVILLMAAWQGHVARRNERFVEGFLLPMAAIGIIAVGFLLQPDYGATFLVAVVSIAIMFVAGVRTRYLAASACAGAAGMGVLIRHDPIRSARVLSVWMPELASEAALYQTQQSIAAFQRGGLRGVGYGRSLLKELYLPEAHTDFILSMAGEELGLIGTSATVIAYVLLLVAGVLTSLRARDKFGRLLAFGMTFHLCFSAAFNIAVVTRSAPTKGLALPFISYGGSNLMASMIALGFLIAVARRCEQPRKTPCRPDAFEHLLGVDPLPGAPGLAQIGPG